MIESSRAADVPRAAAGQRLQRGSMTATQQVRDQGRQMLEAGDSPHTVSEALGVKDGNIPVCTAGLLPR